MVDLEIISGTKKKKGGEEWDSHLLCVHDLVSSLSVSLLWIRQQRPRTVK